MDREIVLALARRRESDLVQGLHQFRPVADHAGLDALGDEVVDQLARILLRILGRGLPPADASGAGQVRVRGTVWPNALRVVRPGPAFPPVEEVAENVEVLLPAGRARVEGLARGQLQARNDEVQLVMPGVGVLNPENVVLVGFQTGEGYRFEGVHDLAFLLRRDLLAGRPAQHACGELPDAILGVDELHGDFGVATQNAGRRVLPARVVAAQQVADGIGPGSLAVRKDLHVHGGSLRASRRSASSRVTTSMVSMPPL